MEKTLVWDLPEGDAELRAVLGHNPHLLHYNMATAHVTGRDPKLTDRAGWRGYNRVYSKYISHLKDDPIKIMEVGVLEGWGLLAWARYFKKASIFGMEIEDKYAKELNRRYSNYEDFERVKVFFSDSTDSYSWLEVDEKFDVIIDDGSHKPKDQVKTLRRAWPYLKKGGYYFIEDISYRYGDSLSFIEAELSLMISSGNPVTAYYHKNDGWAKILNNKSTWKKYGVTEDTPKTAIDFIAVIQKLR